MSNLAKKIAQARTTLPSSVLDGVDVKILADKYGRQITQPYTVRDLVATAAASLTNGTPTTLITGITGTLLDLVYISLTNNSDFAVTVTLTDDSTTVRTFSVPVTTTNSGVVSAEFPIPWPQSTAGSTWRVDMPDISGTTVTVDALYIRN